jgi:hypothetical protein
MPEILPGAGRLVKVKKVVTQEAARTLGTPQPLSTPGTTDALAGRFRSAAALFNEH